MNEALTKKLEKTFKETLSVMQIVHINLVLIQKKKNVI